MWTEFKTLGNVAANAGRTMGFLQADGSVRLAVWDYGNFSSDAVLILGKYQITRNQLCTMQGFEVENVDLANTNFNVTIATSLDGKTLLTPTVPINLVTGALVRKYGARVSGLNHSLIFQGSFVLASIELSMSRQGRR
jgi:hypothetical protein